MHLFIENKQLVHKFLEFITILKVSFYFNICNTSTNWYRKMFRNIGRFSIYLSERKHILLACLFFISTVLHWNLYSCLVFVWFLSLKVLILILCDTLFKKNLVEWIRKYRLLEKKYMKIFLSNVVLVFNNLSLKQIIVFFTINIRLHI